MNDKSRVTSIVIVALATMALTILPPASAFAQGTAFTYQGRLNDGANPATGIFDLRFTIYDSTNLPGTLIAGPLTNSAATVTNGLFTVTVDFGNPFDGSARFLEIAVRTNGGGAFSTLTPRQTLTPVPYAITAGSLPGLSVQGNVVSPSIIGGSSSNSIGSNTIGAIIAGGGASGQPNTIAPAASYSVISGGAQNTASSAYVTISGGQLNVAGGQYSAVVGGSNNVAGAAFSQIGGGHDNGVFGVSTESTIGGGAGNTIHDGSAGSSIGGGLFNTIETNLPGSVIAGGVSNLAMGDNIFTNVTIVCTGYCTISGGYKNQIFKNSGYSTIAGGEKNIIHHDSCEATIGGGSFNTISENSEEAVIGGGSLNQVTGPYGIVPGGFGNVAASHAFAAGSQAKAYHGGSFVWADSQSGQAGDFASTTYDQFSVRAAGGVVLKTSSIRIPGIGANTVTPAFTHKVTSVVGNKTYIDNAVCNNQPNAILFITQNWSAGDAVGNPKESGVYYDAGAGKWTIFVVDGTAMPAGVAYNVLVILP